MAHLVLACVVFLALHVLPSTPLREPLVGPLGVPCTPPPWGLLGAFSLDTGELLWRRPFGATPDLAALIECDLAEESFRRLVR